MRFTRWSGILRRYVSPEVHAAEAVARVERFRSSLARYQRDLGAARDDARRAQVLHNVARVEREIRRYLEEADSIETTNRPRNGAGS